MDPQPAKVQKIMASDEEIIKLYKEIDKLEKENNENIERIKQNEGKIGKLDEKLETVEVKLQENANTSSRLALQQEKALAEQQQLLYQQHQVSLQQTIVENKKIIVYKVADLNKRLARNKTNPRVVHVPRNERVSTQAKRTDAADKINERKPIYMHWFGLEMLSAYESAKSQIENEDYTIEITLGESTYKIEGDSLHKVTAAIECACKICQDGNLRRGRRGFMSLPELRNTELAFSSLVSRALDRFMFPDEATGACLHQAPCRVECDNPERPDVYIIKFNDGFFPGDPLSMSGVKKYDFNHADRESLLYSGVGVEEGDCLDQFPVLIGLPTSYHKMELQLHINVEDMIWKLVVASGYPWDGAILCILRAGVHFLMEQDMLMRSEPLQSPEPFKEMHLYSICGSTERVFRNKDTDTVVKFFDTLEDDFFNPSIMEDLTKQCPTILPQVKLSKSTSERVYRLSYQYIPGIDGRACEQYELRQFLGVVKTLWDMHRYEFVHGDIQLANIVFSEDSTSSLIDFDFVGKHNINVYFDRFNRYLDVRHDNARPGSPMKMEHDRVALKNIISKVCPGSLEKENIVSLLVNPSHSLQEIVYIME